MKSYFNNAVIGNSRILATFDEKGQILRVFWPNIDYSQQIEKMLLGIYFPKTSSSMHWLDSDEWNYNQYYLDDTNILKTVITRKNGDLRIVITDFALNNKDIIIRNIKFENISSECIDLNFAIYCSGISGKSDSRSSFFDFDSDAVVIYGHDGYMFVSSDKESSQFQLTNSPIDACNRLFLYGVEDYSLNPEGAMLWEMGEIKPSEKASLNLYMVFGDDLNKVRNETKEIKKVSFNELFDETKDYWTQFLEGAKKVNTGVIELDKLYKRTVLVFKIMSDETGGIIAAPEFDEESSKTGQYGFCWLRDAAFITTAMDRIGLTDLSRKFYRWAVRTQDSSGAWFQRYYTEGNLAPSWGIQTDETGAVLWGMLHHYKITKDKGFLEETWESVYKAAEYLIGQIDSETGLQKPTYDIWENNYGQHTYTSAAVYGGLTAASKIAKELKKDNILSNKWINEAEKLKGAIEKNLWSEDRGRFLKAINVKLNPWGDEPGETKRVVVNSKGFWRDFSVKDETIDSNLLGLNVPYEVFDINNWKFKGTIKAIEENLTCPYTGGIKRYENDNYVGGNPWVISTLWLAQYYIKNNQMDLAKSILLWTVNHKTSIGFLPEQIDKITGEPAWVIPLTWSHAMFIHVFMDLIEKGEYLTPDPSPHRRGEN